MVVRDLPPADPAAPAIIATPGVGVPNPFVLVDEGRYYMYSSQVAFEGSSIELRISDDARQWEVQPINALPVIPTWAAHGLTWAPDVVRIEDGYVMYLTALMAGVEPKTQCIGVAVADRPEGPFRAAPDPMVCQRDRNGSIDPRTFVDAAGDLWLHWKSDDNADVGGTSRSSIYAQRLGPDGTSLEGEPTRILEVDQGWEGRIVEAPNMVLIDGEHWLFYSGNWFNQPAYGLGVARCEGPAGPCTKPLDGPWLASNAQGTGPGEGSLFVDLDGALWIAYAPVAQDYVTLTPRPVALARVGLGPDVPYLASP
jgi:beta-xylosidase